MLKSEDPHMVPLPEPYEERLMPFQRLMLLKVLREEKVVQGIKEFVKAELGEKFIESPAFDLMGSFNDSVAASPIIFVLSPGADPIAYLLNLAK
jgi:dynein heavy chain